MAEYHIDRIWPVSTKIVPNGGIGVDWYGEIGFGRFELFWGEDGKLHADTECLASDTNREFIKTMMNLIAREVVVDG